MVLRDGTLPTAWLSSRKTAYCAALSVFVPKLRPSTAARSADCRKWRKPWLPRTSRDRSCRGGRCRPLFRCPGQSAPAASETELLRRKLAEANAEIRRYETRLFAYERAMLDLRRENAELQALCEQARAGETLPEPTPQPTVPAGKAGAPGHPFPGPRAGCRVAQGPLPGEIETLLDTGTPEWEPKTKLDHLSVDIISQLEQLMGT